MGRDSTQSFGISSMRIRRETVDVENEINQHLEVLK